MDFTIKNDTGFDFTVKVKLTLMDQDNNPITSETKYVGNSTIPAHELKQDTISMIYEGTVDHIKLDVDEVFMD